ncbi:MAG: galE2, partial [Phycisphaerales bacterium]|nr:galE2 [Phycisphaerales bacterium]
AAAVGVGQSMYEVVNYTSLNNVGVAVLLEALIERPVELLIVASSMSIYGEGLYQSPDGEISAGLERTVEQLRGREWEIRNRRAEVLTPLPTPETKRPVLASVYALSKFDQEKMCLMIGRAYGIPAVALRFFNVYGPRQALSNPYTGVLAIFASRLMNGRPPVVFEDGLQQRDFVSVHDIATACRLALQAPGAAGRAINVGGGRAYTILDIARRAARALGKQWVEPEVSGQYRMGDIRHCFADIRLARRLLDYDPQVALEDGLEELAQWLEGQEADDHLAQARSELDRRGLAI